MQEQDSGEDLRDGGQSRVKKRVLPLGRQEERCWLPGEQVDGLDWEARRVLSDPDRVLGLGQR